MDEARCVHDMVDRTCGICLGLDKPEPKVSIAFERAGDLFDYAVAATTFTSQQACEALGWTNAQFTAAAQALRLIMADDTINLVCEAGPNHVYLWRLVGTMDGAMTWASVRLRSVESQFRVIGSVISSIVNATDGRSRDGKKARLIQAQVNILNLQLESLDH